METLIVFVFRYAIRLFLAWLVLSIAASFVIGGLIRKMGGDD